MAALAVLAVPPAAQAGGSILAVTPHHLKFACQPFGSFTTRTVTITNRSSRTLVVTITDQSPDDFSPGQPGSTCFLSFTVTTEGGKILRTRHVRITGVGVSAI